MNHESMATDKGRKLAVAFCKRYKTLLTLDESDIAIQTPRAARTRTLVHTVGPLAHMRRILTGTPAEDPFELYSQFNFLDPRIHGYDNYLAFKHRYALWEKNIVRAKAANPDGKRPLVEYESLIGYQNLPELHAKLAPFTYRKRKADCLDLPPKIYSTRTVRLSPAQKAIYDELKEHGILLLREAQADPDTDNRRNHAPLGALDVLKMQDATEDDLLTRLASPQKRTTTAIKLTLLLRLQQVLGGFLTDDIGMTRPIDGESPNPRQIACQSVLRGALQGPAKVIIWACFRAEMAALKGLCRSWFPDVSTEAVYGGTHSRTNKQDVIAAFKDPNDPLRILISHEKSLGVGMNFTSAQTEIFYSSGASGRSRIQAEDRCHRIGQTGCVNIYDFDALDSPLDKRLAAFRSGKLDFNATVMSWSADDLKEVI